MLKYMVVAAVALLSVVAAGADAPKDFGNVLPYDFDSSVSGYQDWFTDGLSADWKWFATGDWNRTIENPNMACSIVNGMLYVGVSEYSGDNHLLYVPGDPNLDYSASRFQEVLVRIKLNTYGTRDPDRAGPSVSVNINRTGPFGSTDPNYSRGLNLHFRSGHNFQFLNDGINWSGGSPDNSWVPTTEGGSEWFWLRIRHDENGLFGKFWLADGETPEPGSWSMQWPGYYTGPGGTEYRVEGWAGIGGASGTAATTFYVDYFLLKVDEGLLPTITIGQAVPEPATMSLLALGGLALLRRKNAT